MKLEDIKKLSEKLGKAEKLEKDIQNLSDALKIYDKIYSKGIKKGDCLNISIIDVYTGNTKGNIFISNNDPTNIHNLLGIISKELFELKQKEELELDRL